MPDVPARYSAFISYARPDERSARWLQRCIEGYRLPRHLRGDGPGRLPPVFRDRDDLSAGADLGAALRTALAESAWLIVVCTPAAAASTWVTREIALFRELRGPDRVLTALFDGEASAAFADILRSADGSMPLAADFRPHGDGKRLGSLKLIAPLAGVRLDDLIHRDAARRARRFGFAAVAAALLAIAMGALALVAVRAQAAAEVQRNKAEGFVEFMLTDLRKRLKGVGKLDLLTAVNKRALAYYDGMDLARLPPDSLERRAALLHAMGEDDEKRGNLVLATQQWQEARRTTAALLAAAPGDAKRVFAHSQSEYWVGYGAWRAGNLPAARAAFLAYAKLTDELRRLDPADLDFAMERGYAFSNLGVFILRGLGQAGPAERQFRTALAAFEGVAARRPGDVATKMELADAYGWLADCDRLQGQFDAARAGRARQRDILTALLAADPNNLELIGALSGNRLAVARIELAAGDPEQAIGALRRARGEAERLARADAEDKEARDRLRIIDLVTVTAWLERPAETRPADLAGRTVYCANARAATADEVIAWCRLLRARLVPAEAPALRRALARDPAIRIGRYSTNWGIDFQPARALVAGTPG